MQTVNADIVQELYRSLVLLGAESDLLGTVGSWGDTISDDDVLSDLRKWNEATAKTLAQRLGHYEISGPQIPFIGLTTGAPPAASGAIWLKAAQAKDGSESGLPVIAQ